MRRTFGRITLVGQYLLADLFFRVPYWDGAALMYQRVESRLRPDASSIASAQLYVRLAICYKKSGSFDQARAAFKKFFEIIERVKFIGHEDKKWLYMYAEALSQIVGYKFPNSSKFNEVDYSMVTEGITRRFPIEDIQKYFGIPLPQ